MLSVVTYSAKSAPVFNAELDSAEAVDAILREFSKFTRRSNPVKRPPELEDVALYHAVTPGTRIRISLLRVSFTFKSLLLVLQCLKFLIFISKDALYTLATLKDELLIQLFR